MSGNLWHVEDTEDRARRCPARAGGRHVLSLHFFVPFRASILACRRPRTSPLVIEENWRNWRMAELLRMPGVPRLGGNPSRSQSQGWAYTGGQSLCSFQTSRCSGQTQWNTAVPWLLRCFCIRSSGPARMCRWTHCSGAVCGWVRGQLCDRTARIARPPQTCAFWSKLWPVQLLVLAPKISQILVLHCSKIRTFTQGPEARCRVRQCWREDLRSNFRHVTAASLSQTGRFVIESICQENNIIPNQ